MTCPFVGVLKQKELSEFIVSVIKGQTELIQRKKDVVLDSEPEPAKVSEMPEETPVVHEEL